MMLPRYRPVQQIQEHTYPRAGHGLMGISRVIIYLVRIPVQDSDSESKPFAHSHMYEWRCDVYMYTSVSLHVRLRQVINNSSRCFQRHIQSRNVVRVAEQSMRPSTINHRCNMEPTWTAPIDGRWLRLVCSRYVFTSLSSNSRLWTVCECWVFSFFNLAQDFFKYCLVRWSHLMHTMVYTTCLPSSQWTSSGSITDSIKMLTQEMCYACAPLVWT